MEDKLYLIGEFASMNRVSTRMLRHYDKINILKPSVIKENGYRYYSEQQIAIISKIKMLRDCDFSLEEIAQTLKNHDENFFMEQVKFKMIELNQQTTLHQKAITLLKELSHENEHTDFLNQYGISLTQGMESTLLVSKAMLDLDQLEAGFDKLFALIDKKRLTTNGPAVLLSYFGEKAEDRNQVGVALTKPYEDEQYETILVPRAKRISTIHYGDYYNIGYAYSSLIAYAELNSHHLEALFTERYFIDISHTTSPNQYATEISVFIKNSP